MKTATLSPAAQAVYDAGTRALWDSHGLNSESRCLAAALRAAIDQVLPEFDYPESWIRRDFLAIAAELEG